MARLSKLNNNAFLLLSSLGLSFLIFLGGFSSYLTIAPMIEFISQCSKIIALPIVYRGVGLIASLIFLIWLVYMIRCGIYQKKIFKGFQKSMLVKEELPEGLRKTAIEMGILDNLICVTEARPLAFTFGLFKPKILISDSLVQLLKPEELRAVLLHEKCHVRKKDPLKIFLLKVLFNKVSRLGLISRLMTYFSVTMELQADKYAQRNLGTDQQFLASALLKLIKFEVSPPRFAVGITSVLDARIEHCINDGWLPEFRLHPRDWAVLGGYFVFLLAFVYTFLTNNQAFISVSCHQTYLCHLTYL